MSPQLIEFEAQALKLPPTDRAALAERLIASLDNLNEQQNEQLWIDEADRRYREYKSGSITARTAEAVLSDARDAIK
jgi:putative addiction module component (TIGR02574 family)